MPWHKYNIKVMKNEILKKDSDKLANEFEDIIRNHPDAERSDISNKLMARMRLETIYLTEDVVIRYKASPYVTINPSEVKLKGELNDEDKNYEIRAYSFGPFNPNVYFKEDTLKILWLLREPLMKSGDLDKYTSGRYKYLGGFDQASQYSTWEDIVADDENYKTQCEGTKIKLIRLTQKLLSALAGMEAAKIDQIKDVKLRGQIKRLKDENLNFDENNASEEEIAKVMNKVMKHICILEVNHFPGLAFKGTNSDDGKVKEWANFNVNIISELIKFYNPSIIIFGHTLEYYDNFENFKDEVFKRYFQNDLEIFGDRIVECAYIDACSEEEIIVDKDTKTKIEQFYVGRNIKYLGESGKIYIQANHPSRNYKLKLLELDCNRVKEWYSNKIGRIKSTTE